MEIEVKFRFVKLQHQKLLELLRQKADYKATHYQTNYFIDTETRHLESIGTNFRLRRIEAGDKIESYVTVKANGVLVNGISRIQEWENEINNTVLDEILQSPSSIYSKGLALTSHLPKDQALIISGVFKNTRTIFRYNDLKLECDETTYDFGTAYEVEIEHVEPEKAKAVLY